MNLLEQHAPRSLTREGRINMLHEIAACCLNGTQPSREAAIWFGAAVQAWSRSNDRLEKHLRIAAPQGSRLTAQALLRRHIADVGGLRDDQE